MTFEQRAYRLIEFLFIATVVAIPFSVKVYFFAIDLEVVFPAEPLIALLAVVIIASFIPRRTRPTLDRRALMHPITLAMLGYGTISILATCASTMPMVSFKALTVRTAYIAVFYLYLTCFRSPVAGPGLPMGIRLLRAHGWVFPLIVAYSLVNQFHLGGGRVSAGLSPFPFYIDHTIYSAALVFVLALWGPSVWRAVAARRWDRGSMAHAAVTSLCLAGLYFSFCRAAWLSVLVCVGFLLLQRLGLRFRGVLVVGSALLLTLFIARDPVMRWMRTNTVDSNEDNAGFRASVLSVTNINTDLSNTERLNRWSCAYRMFLDRPLLGFGPGTFQFAYLPFQRPEEKTFVSATDTRDPAKIQRTWSFSDQLFVRKNPQLHYYSGGTAHSEYLLALSEGGILSFIAFVAIGFFALRAAMRLYTTTTEGATKGVVLAVGLGIMAYYVHSFFNNFLDDCKIAFLFWGSLSVLTTFDLEGSKRAKGAI